MQYRNLVVLISSLLFYFIDGGYFTIILCSSIFFNYLAGLFLYSLQGNIKKYTLFLSIGINLAPLIFYKYWMFFVQSTNDLSSLVNGRIHIEVPEILLLAGVSFFTFHAISYLIDVYSLKVQPEKSVINFGMYMVNFPQLIAGPIVRYSEIANVITARASSKEQIFLGLFTFVIGLVKKVVFADSAGVIADDIFSISQDELTTGLAWLGALAYTLQIYFDFAGYSDMAIGLGRIMGFEFPENFNQPYRAKNVTEFWRRWHMTLSRWFRDYVYIPLGGNKKGNLITLINLVIVFILCGLWHGAAYTFLVWGLYHGFLLVVERWLNSKFNFKTSGLFGQLVTFILVLFGWVIFRSSSLSNAIGYIEIMLGLAEKTTILKEIFAHLRADKLLYLTIASICAVFPVEYLNSIKRHGSGVIIMEGIIMLILLIFCTILIASNGFNPFIYFRF